MNRKKVLILLFALLASCGIWAQNGWAIYASHNNDTDVTTFTISRTNTAVAETVHYRLVNLSAYAGQHYNVIMVNGQTSSALSGNLSFSAGDESKTVQVREQAATTNAYKYQTTDTERSYKLEVTDAGGFFLAGNTRSFSTGTSFSADKVSQSITNLVYFSGTNYNSAVSSSKYVDVSYTPPASQVETSGTLSGYVLIDDSYDYAQKAATVSTSSLISTTGADTAYLNNMGCKIYATVCFTEKERDDGYQYIQIIAGNGSASYDTGYDPEKTVNDPVNSVYKVCFELSTGSDAQGKQFFPHRYNYANKSAETSAHIGITEFSQTDGKLWQQKFKSGYQATNSGSLVFKTNVANITTRFDAGGNNDDTWGYKDLFVRMALVDATAPTKLAVSVAPGKHCKGNTVYVSVAFNEIVKVTGTPKLTTENHWGDLNYVAGDGTNVLTFSATIPENATGYLNITGLSGTVKDLAGNNLVGSGVTASNLCPLDVSYPWPITYDLTGGTASNPATYTWETPTFTLTNPTRSRCTFLGWTGSNGNEPQTTVTIANHSHTPLSYTAHWMPLWWGIPNGADGSAEHPYLIATTEDLDTLAALVGRGTSFSSTYFLQTADIVYAGTLNNYTPVGRLEANPFGGRYDGGGYTISGINVSSSYDEYGLFGRLSSTAMVQNLTLASSTFTAHHSVGGIVGYNDRGRVQNCRVESTVTINADSDHAYHHGGVVGYNYSGSVGGCLCAATVSNNGKPENYYYGGIVGRTYLSSIVACLFTGPTPTSDQMHKGSIAGEYSGTFLNNYYTVSTLGGVNTADRDGARKARTVTLGTDISIAGAQTHYSHSGITVIGPGNRALYLSDGTFYSGAGQTLTLVHNSAPAGYHAIFSYNDGSDHLLADSTLTMPDADITVSCTGFAVTTYTVRFQVNGGSGTMADQAFTGAVTQALTANAFTRSGYFFSGWNTAADGSGTAYSDGQSVTDLTTTHGTTVNLYAQWTPNYSLWNADANHDGTTEERAYIITTTGGLDLLASLVKDGNTFSGTFFKLGDDIAYGHTSDWNENNYTPIGSGSTPFSGTFDGCGHTVSGIRIYVYSYKGLFGHVSGGTVKNVTVADTRINSNDYCGGIVGYNNGTVENCHATATVAVYANIGSAHYHGGIAGKNDGLINGCTSSATVNNLDQSSCNYYGGVVGYNAGTVSHCVSIDAVVKATGNQDPVAYNDGGTVTNCYYRNCTVNDVLQSNINAIVASSEVSVVPVDDASVAFPYGGLRFYGSSLFGLGNTLYTLLGSTTLSLTLTYTGTDTFYGFITQGGTLSGTANPYALTMPAESGDVTIMLIVAKNPPYSYDFETEGDWDYWKSLSGNNRRTNGYERHSGSYSLQFRGSTSNVVALPPINAATSSLQLSFWSRPEFHHESRCGTFSVGYLTDPTDAATFVAVRTYSNSDWTSNDFRRKVVNFEGALAPDGSRLAFRHNPTDNDYYWYVDDVEVTAPDCFVPEELAVSNIGVTAATVSWLAAAGTQWEYALVANAADDYTPTDADFSGNNYTATQSGTQTITIDTLTELSPYTFFLRRVCSEQSKSEAVSVRFRTRMTSVPVPFADDFESSNGWILENGTLTNQWVWGTAAHDDGTKALYISNDGGTTNAYSNGKTRVFAWKSLSFEEGHYRFSYDWRAKGESNSDYLRVFLVSDEPELTAGGELPNGRIPLHDGYCLSESDEWQHVTTDTIAIAAGTYKMVFVWENSYSGNYDPPAAVDNVSIVQYKHFVTDGSWDNAVNWSPAGVPTADDGVFIQAAAVIPDGCVARCDQAYIDGGSVTIADGGQLVCNRQIPVTVQKAVAAGQWNGISGMYYTMNLSPLTSDVAYDLFSYDEENARWLNQKASNGAAGFTRLDGFHGYLYRRANSATLDLATDNYTGNSLVYYYALCSDDALRGFNLAGNPCTHDIYFGTGIEVRRGSIAPGFYTLNADGTWRAHTTADPIHVAEAFLMQVTIDETHIGYNNTNAAPAQSKAAQTATLAFSVKGNGHEDIAYALLTSHLSPFTSHLAKMPHLNAAAPSLCIDGYAIATLDEETEAFPLTLQAALGEYTLALSSSTSLTSSASYLHLIDKLAGRDIDLLRDSSYTFHATGNDAGRFLVKLSSNAQETPSPHFAHQQGSEIIVTGEGTLEAYDIMGRQLFTKEISPLTSHLSPFTFPSTGVYILRLNGQSQKIVIK